MKTIRQKWMKEVFIPSFGICEHRYITTKQAEIFMRYLEQVEDNHQMLNKYGNDYVAKCADLIIYMYERYIGKKQVFTLTITKEGD